MVSPRKGDHRLQQGRELGESRIGSIARCTMRLLAHYEGTCLCGDDSATRLKPQDCGVPLPGPKSLCGEGRYNAKGDLRQHPCTWQHRVIHGISAPLPACPMVIWTAAHVPQNTQRVTSDLLQAGQDHRCGQGPPCLGYSAFASGYPGTAGMPPNPGDSNQHQTGESERPAGLPTALVGPFVVHAEAPQSADDTFLQFMRTKLLKYHILPLWSRWL